jgi:hypothetical protein
MSIESVYGSLLRRSPDEGAYGTYAGWSDDDIANAIYGSQEYANLQQQSQPQQQEQQQQQPQGGGGVNVDQINQLYQQYLGRSADQGGINTYMGMDYGQLANILNTSPERQNYLSSQQQQQQQQQPQPQAPAPQPQQPAYTPEPSYGEYNFEMTGKPSDVELATNSDMANAWYRFSGTSPAPAMTWETAPSTVTAAPGLISFYGAYGLPKPFSEEDIRKPVDPSTISYGYGNTPYAGVKSNVPGLMSGGEYIVDPKTNKFVLDASGNPIHVPIEPYKQGGFTNIMDNYLIPAFIGAAAIPVLGGLAGQALGGLGGATAAEGAALGAEGVAGGTSTGTGLTSAGSGYSGVGLNPALQTGGELAYSGVGLNPAITGSAGVGLNAAIPGITSGLATNAGALAAASGIPITADIFGAAGGLTASQSAALDAALTAGDYAAASSLVPAGSTLAKLLAPAVKALGTATTATKAAQTSSLLPNLLRQGTGTMGGSAQAALPGIYREPFNPFAFGNQQPVQSTNKGFDFLSALSKEGAQPSMTQASAAQPSSATARNQLLANLLF